MLASVLFFGVVVLIISASVLVTQQQADRVTGQATLAESVELTAHQLGDLSSDYILYRESLQVDRWRSKYATLEHRTSRGSRWTRPSSRCSSQRSRPASSG